MRLTSHVRFGGGPLEKGLITGTSLAAYPTARPVRVGGSGKRNERQRRQRAPSRPHKVRQPSKAIWSRYVPGLPHPVKVGQAPRP